MKKWHNVWRVITNRIQTINAYFLRIISILVILIARKESPTTIIFPKLPVFIWYFSIHISYRKTINCDSITCKTPSCFIPISKDVFYVTC